MSSRSGIGRGVEDLVVGEGFEPQCFVFYEKCVHLPLLMVGERDGASHCYFWGSRGLKVGHQETYGLGRVQHSPAAGGSLALASMATFQVPSGSFFQTVK